MSVLQTRWDDLPNGAFVYYSDTIPNSLGSAISGRAGDLCVNTSTASGQPIAWRCTAAGTPGTWEALGSVGTAGVIATETGANNAIIGALSNVSLTTGMTVTVKLAHTLQAGANTFAFNGATAAAIKSHFNPANNIATAYAVGGYVTLLWDGTEWLDMSQ